MSYRKSYLESRGVCTSEFCTSKCCKLKAEERPCLCSNCSFAYPDANKSNYNVCMAITEPGGGRNEGDDDLHGGQELIQEASDDSLPDGGKTTPVRGKVCSTGKGNITRQDTGGAGEMRLADEAARTCPFDTEYEAEINECGSPAFTYTDKSGLRKGLSLGGTGGAVFDPYLLVDRTLGCMLLKKLGICLCGQDEDVGNVIYKSVDFGIDYATVYYPPPCKPEKKGLEADFTMNIVNIVFDPATAEYYLQDKETEVFLAWSFLANPIAHFSQTVSICDPVFCNQTVYSGLGTKGFYHYLAHHGIPVKMFKVVGDKSVLLGEGVINTQPLFQYPGRHVYIVTKIEGGACIALLRGWYELDANLDAVYDYLDYAREEHHRYAILAAHTGPRLRRVDETKLGTGDECLRKHEIPSNDELWSLDKQMRRMNNELVGSTQSYEPPEGEKTINFWDLDDCNAYDWSKRFEAVLFSDGGKVIRPAEVCVPIPRPCDADVPVGQPATTPMQPPSTTSPDAEPPPRAIVAPPCPEPSSRYKVAEGKGGYETDEPASQISSHKEGKVQKHGESYQGSQGSLYGAALAPPPNMDVLYRTRTKYPPRYTFRRLMRRQVRQKFFGDCRQCLGNRRIMFNVYDQQKMLDIGLYCCNHSNYEADDIVIEIVRLELNSDVVQELKSCYEALFIDFSFLGNTCAESLGLPPAPRMMFRSQHRFCFSRNFNMKERSVLKEMLNPSGRITSRVIRFLVVGDPGDDPEVGGRCWDIAYADLRVRTILEKTKSAAKKMALPVFSLDNCKIGKVIIRIFGKRLLKQVYKERTEGPCVPEV